MIVNPPKRLLIPHSVLPLVRVFARSAGVEDWTDLGSGDGTTVSMCIAGLNLRSRNAVLLCSDPPKTLAAWTIHNSDVKDWVHKLSGEAGDCVSMFDVLEHFEKPQGKAILDKLEAAFRAVVVFTPRGFLKQDAETHPQLRDDPLMWHRSGFTEQEFADRGYLVFVWPMFHFPPNQRPHGALLALKLRDVSDTSSMGALRAALLCEHRRLLLSTAAFRLFAVRWLLWSALGSRGIRFISERNASVPNT